MKKQILSIALVLIFILAPAPVSVTAEAYAQTIPPVYSEARDFSEGLAAVRIDSKWGYIDKTGKEVIPFIYDWACDFSEGLACVRINNTTSVYGGHFGFIDKTGNVVLPFEYPYRMGERYMFSDGFAVIHNGSGWVYIDKTGKTLATKLYTDIRPFSEGLAAVKSGGRWGFIDETGKEVIPCEYRDSGRFSDGMALVTRIGYRGFDSRIFIDKTGIEIFGSENGGTFSEGLASINDHKEKSTYIVDKTGKVIATIPFYVWEYAEGYYPQPFSEGLAAFPHGGFHTHKEIKWGFTDRAGNVVVTPKYDYVDNFSDGLALVSIGDRWGDSGDFGYIDKTGKEVVPLSSGKKHSFSEGLAAVNINGKWGYISISDVYAGGLAPAPAPANPLDTAAGWAKPGITEALAKGFVPADLQGRYNNNITRAEFCRMAVKWLEFKTGGTVDKMLNDGRPLNEGTFSDTSDPDILAAYKLGITVGTVAPTADKPGVFNPNGDFSREQAAAMIRNTCKAAGMDISNTAMAGFEDIGAASPWAVDGINFCRNNGIMGGTSTTPLLFGPKVIYTREQSIVTFNNIK